MQVSNKCVLCFVFCGLKRDGRCRWCVRILQWLYICTYHILLLFLSLFFVVVIDIYILPHCILWALKVRLHLQSPILFFLHRSIRDKIVIFPGIYWQFQLFSFILRPILRILAEKVRWVWFWRWEFSVKLEPCYVVLIPTLRRTLRLFFLGMVKTAFYSPGSWKSREHSRGHFVTCCIAFHNAYI